MEIMHMCMVCYRPLCFFFLSSAVHSPSFLLCNTLSLVFVLRISSLTVHYSFHTHSHSCEFTCLHIYIYISYSFSLSFLLFLFIYLFLISRNINLEKYTTHTRRLVEYKKENGSQNNIMKYYYYSVF